MMQPFPQYRYAPPAVRPAPRPAPPRQQVARPPTPAVVRGQSPEEPPARAARPPLEMPPPEALGVPVPATAVDWTDVRVKLDRLGATGFALERLPEGGYRFACRVPSADGVRAVEGRAATEAEAVRRALEQAGR
jgi:hypothetical protein